MGGEPSPLMTDQHKDKLLLLLLLLLLRWGRRSARLCAFRGLLLRWLLLLCQSRHGRRPGPQKDNNTAAQQKSCFFGVGLRCRSPLRLPGCCCRATRTPDQQIPPPPQVFSCSGSSSEGSKTAAGGSAGRGSRAAAARAETLKNANGKILFSQLGKLCRVRLSCLLFPVDGSK